MAEYYRDNQACLMENENTIPEHHAPGIVMESPQKQPCIFGCGEDLEWIARPGAQIAECIIIV